MRLSKFRIFTVFALTALVSGVFTLPIRAKEPIQTQNFRPLLIAQSSTDTSSSSVSSFFAPLNANTIYVLGADGKLWLEHGPFGTVPPQRQQVDANVSAFAPLDSNTIYVLGTDGKLWLEHGPFGTVPPQRQQVDANVSAFAPLDSNTIYVLGTDGKLWLEHGPFGTVPPQRQQVDANVNSYHLTHPQQ